MTKPQQPELHRHKLGSTDRDGKELRASERREQAPSGPDAAGPVPEDNEPGHRPAREQDKPQGPPVE